MENIQHRVNALFLNSLSFPYDKVILLEGLMGGTTDFKDCDLWDPQ